MGYRTDDVPIPSRDDIRLGRERRGVWAPDQPEIRVQLDLEFDESERRAVPELLSAIQLKPPPDLPEGKVQVTWTFPPRFRRDGTRLDWWQSSVEPSKPYVTSWLRSRSFAVSAWLRRTPGVTPELLDEIGGISFFPQDRNLRERVLGDGQSVSPPSERELAEELNVGDNRSQLEGTASSQSEDPGPEPSRPRQRSVAEILHYLSDYTRGRVTELPDERNWEKRIQQAFHEVCAPKKYVGYLYREENPLGAPVLEDNGYQYPLMQAASGEQVILEYITRLTFPRPLQRSLILIDEPEVHLHPAWVRQLYLALPKLPGSNQYILTTHSPELRKRAAADNALVDLGQLSAEV
jgi:hypothetical protein